MSDHESWDDFSDEEEVPLSQNAHKKSKDPSEYRIKGALKVPHLVSYTAQSLFGGSLDSSTSVRLKVLMEVYVRTNACWRH